MCIKEAGCWPQSTYLTRAFVYHLCVGLFRKSLIYFKRSSKIKCLRFVRWVQFTNMTSCPLFLVLQPEITALPSPRYSDIHRNCNPPLFVHFFFKGVFPNLPQHQYKYVKVFTFSMLQPLFVNALPCVISTMIHHICCFI